jgi:hypothetical protein
MFEGPVTLRGQEATVVWGFRTAAVVTSWTAARTPQGQWTLQAIVSRADPYQLRQRPLKFTAPRIGGYFCWPIVAVSLGAGTLSASLGPPES